MSNLLIFFALPLATILIAIVLERIWKNYILVTLFIFAIYLIVAFALGDANLLVLVIIYTLIALIASFLSMLVRRLERRLRNLENQEKEENQENTERTCCRQRNNVNNNGRMCAFRGQCRRRF